MSYRMARLAQRYACYWGGGGGTTTTSAEIPDELKPLVEGSSDRMLSLQEKMWGTDGEGGIGIADEHAREVVGLSDPQKYGTNMKRIRDLGERSWGEQAAMGSYKNVSDMGGRRVTGESIAGDPAVKAAYDTFNTFEKPMIEDSATQAGMGRSAQKGDKMSMGLQQMMLPQIQAAQQREESGLNRDLQSYMGAAGGQANLGRDEVSRKRGALDYSMGAGDVERGVAQEGKDAGYNDFIRRAALGESALTGPFGSMVPSTIGSQVSSSSGK
jgi:hypothetical protein